VQTVRGGAADRGGTHDAQVGAEGPRAYAAPSAALVDERLAAVDPQQMELVRVSRSLEYAWKRAAASGSGATCSR
jgi:hypothetical protein